MQEKKLTVVSFAALMDWSANCRAPQSPAGRTLWRLNEDGRKLYTGTIEAADPRELVIKWSAFLATAERGTYFATYRGSFVGPEPALENEAGAIAA
jgi:hypothetical protein